MSDTTRDLSHQNGYAFWRRLLIYQAERFPVLAHGVMIAAFTFSAVSYSRICRGAEGFIEWVDFAIGVFITVSLFFLVRIFDEFKDQEDDRRYRSYLPVPRGLVTLRELRWLGIATVAAQVMVLLLLQPRMLYLYMLVLVYLSLMGVEFFVPTWLKARQILYITSHMFIIPLIDLYASGLDWLLADAEPHLGLLWFFAVSYANGLVLEFGRKIRTSDQEEPNVVSYTGLYGTKGGVRIWLGLLAATFLLAIGASAYAGYGAVAYVVLAVFFAMGALPGFLWLQRPTVQRSKYIEYASAGWTVLMYLSLGAVPMLERLV